MEEYERTHSRISLVYSNDGREPTKLRVHWYAGPGGATTTRTLQGPTKL